MNLRLKMAPLAAAFALVMVVTNASNAALVKRDIEGEVTSVDGASGIAVGDTVSGQVRYDDNDVGGSVINVLAESLELVFPENLVLDETDDIFFGSGGPTINFNNSGDVRGFLFDVDNIAAYGFNSLDFRTASSQLIFGFADGGSDVVRGELTVGSPTSVTSVPVPASMGLLGVALFGLWAATRKR